MSRSRKLSFVSWLPEFNMADVKPEVHLYTEVEGLSGEVQRLLAHFRQRLSTGDYADIVQNFDDHCLTVADIRKPKWRPVNRKYAISQDWIELSEKFRWLHPHFRPRPIQWSYCQHCPTSADNRKPKWRIKTGSTLYLRTGLRYQRKSGGHTHILDHAHSLVKLPPLPDVGRQPETKMATKNRNYAIS